MMFLVLCKDNDIGQKNDKKNERLIEQRNLFFFLFALFYFILFWFSFSKLILVSCKILCFSKVESLCFGWIWCRLRVCNLLHYSSLLKLSLMVVEFIIFCSRLYAGLKYAKSLCLYVYDYLFKMSQLYSLIFYKNSFLLFHLHLRHRHHLFPFSNVFLYNSCSFSWKFSTFYFDIYRLKGLSCLWPYYRLTYRKLLFTCDIPKKKQKKKREEKGKKREENWLNNEIVIELGYKTCMRYFTRKK